MIKPHLGLLLTNDWKQKPIFHGLIGCWPMVEGGGNRLTDISGYNNHGIISGASWVGTPWGPGLSFDGTDDYVNCGTMHYWGKDSGADDWQTLAGCTIAVWYKTTSTSRGCLVGSNTGVNGSSDSEAKVFLIINHSSTGWDETTGEAMMGHYQDSNWDSWARRNATGYAPIYDGDWHVMAGAVEGDVADSQMGLYLDGVNFADEYNSEHSQYKRFEIHSGLGIGASIEDDGSRLFHFNGVMSLVMVWQRRLAPNEIAEISKLNPGSMFSQELNPGYYGAINLGTPEFNPAWAINSNQVL